MKNSFLFIIAIILPHVAVFAQKGDGSIEGVIVDSSSRLPLHSASIELRSLSQNRIQVQLSDKTGFFSFDSLDNGFYHLKVSFSGFRNYKLDSLQIYVGKKDIILGEINLKPGEKLMDEVVIYAEKPMIQTKDGNIILNVGESPLSAGSNASDLLKAMPLVNADPDGKVTVRGREPRILIDDKPVDLNGQQLNDFLESFPGGMIEKIELLSNPPPQYANEPGGVINIVTRKGRVGFTGRTNIYAGTRGESGINNSLNYRQKGFVFNLVAGGNSNRFTGNSSSYRQNIYKDSTNALRTSNRYINRSVRPNLQLNLEYDISPKQQFSAQVLFNGNDVNNDGLTRYLHYNQKLDLYKYSTRSIGTSGNTWNPSIGLNYLYKGRKDGERLRIILNGQYSDDGSEKDFLQKYFSANDQSLGQDSSQSQINLNKTMSWNGRILYDLPIGKAKTILSAGITQSMQKSHITLDTYFRNDLDELIFNPLISSDLIFKQYITTSRFSIKQTIKKGLHITTGMLWEITGNSFDIFSQQKNTSNSYENFLPFFNAGFNLPSGFNINASYRTSIRRPGIRELNPAIDYTDPINLRYGNPNLNASPSHNFDLTAGITKSKIYGNIGLGYNKIDNIFAQVRTLGEFGKTHITWENISAKQEYEISSWMGMEVFKGFRINLNAGYTFNQYSQFDIAANNYRNAGSLNGKINMTYVPAELWNLSANLGYNRFANPQGTVRSTVSMYMGAQRKFFKKKLVMAIGIIDPIIQQGYNNITIGKNFTVNSIGTTNTRNFRLSATYLFNVKPIKSSK